MEFVVFVWFVAVILFFLVGVLTSIGQIFVVKNPIKNNTLFLGGLVILSGILYLYIPFSQYLWNTFNDSIYPSMQNMGEYRYLLSEVWYTIVFFRNMWPAILISLMISVIDAVQHPVTFRYRMLKQFSHNKLLILVSAGFLYFITKSFSTTFATLFLGVAVYVIASYWKFGFAIVLYILKQNKIPYEVGMLLMIASTITAGEYFLLPIVMFVGFGISDIWMDYYQRDSASLIFNFDYH